MYVGYNFQYFEAFYILFLLCLSDVKRTPFMSWTNIRLRQHIQNNRFASTSDANGRKTTLIVIKSNQNRNQYFIINAAILFRKRQTISKHKLNVGISIVYAFGTNYIIPCPILNAVNFFFFFFVNPKTITIKYKRRAQ